MFIFLALYLLRDHVIIFASFREVEKEQLKTIFRAFGLAGLI